MDGAVHTPSSHKLDVNGYIEVGRCRVCAQQLPSDILFRSVLLTYTESLLSMGKLGLFRCLLLTVLVSSRRMKDLHLTVRCCHISPADK